MSHHKTAFPCMNTAWDYRLGLLCEISFIPLIPILTKTNLLPRSNLVTDCMSGGKYVYLEREDSLSTIVRNSPLGVIFKTAANKLIRQMDWNLTGNVSLLVLLCFWCFLCNWDLRKELKISAVFHLDKSKEKEPELATCEFSLLLFSFHSNAVSFLLNSSFKKGCYMATEPR